MAAAAALAGVLLAAIDRPAEPRAEAVTIALPRSPPASLVSIAKVQGYFSEEGLDVTIVPASHGKAAFEMLAQGRADLAAAADVVFALAIAGHGDFAIVTQLSSARRDEVIVARRDRGIAAARDLAGKTVGVTFRTAGDYFLWALLAWNKVSPDSVALVDLLPGDIPGALADGRIDAASTWHPAALRAQEALGANGVTFAEEDAYTQSFVLIGKRAGVKSRASTMQRLLRALIKAEHFVRSDPEGALRLAGAHVGVDPETLRAPWGDLRFKVELTQAQLITLEEEALWAMARGHAASGPLPDYLGALDMNPLLAVDRGRVTVLR